MGIIIKLTDANFTYAGLPTYVEKLFGFTADNLQNLYLLDDADPKALAVDKKSVFNSTAFVGNASGAAKSNLTGGGGINLLKNSYLAGSPVDARLPYTIMFSGVLGVPSSGIQGILGMKEYFDYGIQLYGSNSSGNPVGTLVGVNSRQAINGAQDGATIRIKAAASWKIGDKITVFLNYDGNGKLYWYAYDGANLVDTDTLWVAINETGYTTNASAVVQTNLTPVVGTGSTSGTFVGGNLNIDVFAVYTKSLTANEMALNGTQGKSIMIARGR